VAVTDLDKAELAFISLALSPESPLRLYDLSTPPCITQRPRAAMPCTLKSRGDQCRRGVIMQNLVFRFAGHLLSFVEFAPLLTRYAFSLGSTNWPGKYSRKKINSS